MDFASLLKREKREKKEHRGNPRKKPRRPHPAKKGKEVVNRHFLISEDRIFPFLERGKKVLQISKRLGKEKKGIRKSSSLEKGFNYFQSVGGGETFGRLILSEKRGEKGRGFKLSRILSQLSFC